MDRVILFFAYGGALSIAFLLMFAAQGLTLIQPSAHFAAMMLSLSALVCILMQGVGWWIWADTGLLATGISLIVWLLWSVILYPFGEGGR